MKQKHQIIWVSINSASIIKSPIYINKKIFSKHGTLVMVTEETKHSRKQGLNCAEKL